VFDTKLTQKEKLSLKYTSMLKLNEIHHGDCLELMRDISTDSIDMILCDPPYGTTQCKWDSIIPLESIWKQLMRITKDNGAICIFGTEPFSSMLRMSNVKNFKYDWIWKKAPCNFLNSKHQPLRNTEIISVFYKKKPLYIRQKVEPIEWKRHGEHFQTESLGRYNPCEKNQVVKDFAYPRTIIEHIKKEDTRKIVHPTQKPIVLLEYFIKTYTKEQEIILDFTIGSGSTAISAINTNRQYIGIEKEEKYVIIAKERIASHI